MSRSQVAARALRIVVAGAALSSGCGDDPPLERSCGGETVGNCRAYEYAVVTEASVTPDGISPGDPAVRAQVHVVLDTCGEQAPMPHRILVRGLASRVGLPDAGPSTMVFTLADLRDDGSTDGDAVAKDGIVDVTLDNPFFDLPASTDVLLRFEPRIDLCSGEALEVPYRTGPRAP